MDLGLGGLSDEQIVELLDQVLRELAKRDHCVRTAAQAVIFTRAEALKQMRQAVDLAVRKVRAKHLEDLRAAVLELCLKDWEAGLLRVRSPEEEAKLIAQAEEEYRTQLNLAVSCEQSARLAAFWAEHARKQGELAEQMKSRLKVR